VAAAEAKEEITADGGVDGKSDPGVEDAVDREVLLGALARDVESAHDAAFGVLLVDADGCAVACGSWLVRLFGIVLCVTTNMLILIATGVDVVVGAWICSEPSSFRTIGQRFAQLANGIDDRMV
jgi:hypothetical protein